MRAILSVIIFSLFSPLNDEWNAGDVDVSILPGLQNSFTFYRILIHELEHTIQRRLLSSQLVNTAIFLETGRTGLPAVLDAALSYQKEYGAMIMEWMIIRFSSPEERQAMIAVVEKEGGGLNHRNKEYLLRTIQNGSMSLADYIRAERQTGRNSFLQMWRVKSNSEHR